jgi:hypothetical protein
LRSRSLADYTIDMHESEFSEATGVYEVTKQLPHDGREFEYRIKSANEEHERVAREGELTKA